MQRVMSSLCVLVWLNAVTTVAAQGFYPDFALVVQLPSYETFMTNLGDSPIRVDFYEITSPSGSLSPSGWKTLSSGGPEIVTALGPGADQFFDLGAGVTELREGNFGSSATWQPGQSWSIGFPFNSEVLGFADAVFRISSPDGLLLTGGTLVTSPERATAALLVVPEPPSGDFNTDGTVDAADYVVWRKGLGTMYNQSDHGVWRAHFGTSFGSGSSSAAYRLGPSAEPLSATIPEPSTLILLILAAVGWCLHRRHAA